MEREYMTSYGLALDEAVRTYAPTVWREYYDEMSGNAIIPTAEMTAELWEETKRLLEAVPYFPSDPPYDRHGFLLMWYEMETDEDTTEPSWCITSWIE